MATQTWLLLRLLQSLLDSKEKAKEKIFYSYTNSINGFAAVLEEEEASALAKHPDVVSVFLNKARKLHTTHSWSFLGLEKDGVVPPSSLWKKARYGEDAIIGNLDTGEMHKELVGNFFGNANDMLQAYGEIHVTPKTSPPFCHWNILERDDFKMEDYPGYSNKRGEGDRCDQHFPLGE
ncbi:hypothetical protein POTOM_040278 [Populus tomentosa]|uniref:Inhibitor I9 domain-containing protein n=1 Tax=Populus tomentosa TaxID=118781 RepID=A0A8X7Z4Q9_POPTO|nr:hypothetical protein POTOM_040278 [Populus tomentosa]